MRTLGQTSTQANGQIQAHPHRQQRFSLVIGCQGNTWRSLETDRKIDLSEIGKITTL